MLVILPLCFAVLPWDSKSTNNLLNGYVFINSLLLIALFALRFLGKLDPDHLFGIHKNVLGLSFALTSLTLLSKEGTQSQTSLALLSKEGTNTVPSLLALLTKEGKDIVPSLLRRVREVIFIVGMGMLGARSSLLSLLIGLLIIMIVKRQWIVFLGIFCLCIVAFLGGVQLAPKSFSANIQEISESSPSIRGRKEQFEQSIVDIRKHWLLGDGFRARRDIHPHNWVLLVLAENGVVGFVLFVWILFAQAKLFWKMLQNPEFSEHKFFVLAIAACSVAIMVHALFDPFWRRGPLWISWAGAGILFALNQPPLVPPSQGGESIPLLTKEGLGKVDEELLK